MEKYQLSQETDSTFYRLALAEFGFRWFKSTEHPGRTSFYVGRDILDANPENVVGHIEGNILYSGSPKFIKAFKDLSDKLG